MLLFCARIVNNPGFLFSTGMIWDGISHSVLSFVIFLNRIRLHQIYMNRAITKVISFMIGILHLNQQC